MFLYGRMIGAAAEIDDHLNRGRNMDTRTPEAGLRVRDVRATGHDMDADASMRSRPIS